MTLAPDPTDPGWAYTDCPTCDFTTRIRWPPSNPRTVEIRCHGCTEWHEVDRDGEVVDGRAERQEDG